MSDQSRYLPSTGFYNRYLHPEQKYLHFRLNSVKTGILLLLGLLVACNGSTSSQTKVLQSQVQRDLSPQVSSADLDILVQGNNAFAFSFYQQVSAEDGNLFYSPLSLSLALAMTYTGARGETASQMAQTLQFLLPQARLHPAFNHLELQLNTQPETGKDDPQPFQLSIANSLWGERTYSFLPDFLDLIALNYGAGLRLMDFAGAPEASRQVINQWVYQETHEKIKDLIPSNAISSDTRLVLANAIYFKADWIHRFNPALTREMLFTLLDGGHVSVSMMHTDRPAKLNFMAGEGFQAVELPYEGEGVTMLVLIPDQGRFSEFEASLSAEKISNIQASLQEGSVSLIFPQFSFEKEFSLAETLTQMGMPDAFCSGSPDFSGLDGSKSLCISQVFHKAFVAVDEQGTEAAAASAVVMVESAFTPELLLIVDRPFVFIIHDKITGSILFVGRLLNPSL